MKNIKKSVEECKNSIDENIVDFARKIRNAEAVPETKAKTLQIVSAYKTMVVKGGGQMLDAVQIPQLNVRNAYAATPVNNVLHFQEKVNSLTRNLAPNNKKEPL
jgi:hypothetical protein